MLLQDQFDIEDGIVETVVVEELFEFCNPVVKTHLGTTTPIRNPDAHLKLYRLDPQPERRRQVTVRNQFGDQVLDVFNPVILAVPTQKLSVNGTSTRLGFPTGLDHFKCWKVAPALLSPNPPKV